MVNRLTRQPRARKRFGQHFLTDESVLERIADAVRLKPTDQLLEIGPGAGALTRHLYGLSARFVAVELDRDLIAPLEARFPELELVSGDILSQDLDSLLAPGIWRLVGNLPYNITSPLLVKLFQHLSVIKDMHFMFQRELAQRIAGEPGTKSWGRLGIVTQYHCHVEPLFDVHPGSFAPPPRVHSQVVRLTPREQRLEVNLETFGRVLTLAFSARRKRIANALKSLDLDWDRAGVNPDDRADVLSVQQFVNLANAVQPTS